MDQKKSRDREAITMRNTTRLPEDWIPTWEVPAILKGAEWAMKGGEKLVEWIKSEGPLWIQILDSRADGDKYVVEFRATNMTVHGVYIDSLALTFPIQQSLELILRRLNFGFDVDEGASRKPPSGTEPKSKLIPSAHSLTFIIEFPRPKPEDLKTSLLGREMCLGTAKVDYWVLNEKSRRTKDVEFGIRLP